ncbi:MAG: 2-isopropylmalate synthase, partial [Clostridia bacterium]|nr:2-isopropylmalate synthase [Clostridia bacterium]
HWTVPYLPIDPTDVGREYEGDVIRINSQSGKGGIGYLMEQRYGIVMPAKMRENFGYAVKSVSDHAHKELQPDEVYKVFEDKYVNIESPIKIIEHHYKQVGDIETSVTMEIDGERPIMSRATGNGRLDAVSNAIKNVIGDTYHIVEYQEHARTKTSKSQAVAYVCIEVEQSHELIWGVGIHNDIIDASVKALVSALNRR